MGATPTRIISAAATRLAHPATTTDSDQQHTDDRSTTAMLTIDPLTNLSARGQATHRETREAVVKALLGSGDTWTRQEVAKAAWKRGSDDLDRLRQQALQAAHAAAEGHRRDLFDMTRAAAHVTGDTLARETAREAAKRAARKVKSESEALGLIAAAVRKPNTGGGFPLVAAGAVAERAHDEGWNEAVMAWATSGVGAARGGLAKVAALQYADRVARGDKTLRGLQAPDRLQEMVASLRLPWVETA